MSRSFHVRLVNFYIPNWSPADFKQRLISFKAEKGAEANGIDTNPYGCTQAFRICGSAKRGKNNMLQEVRELDGLVFSTADRLRERLSLYIPPGAQEMVATPFVMPRPPRAPRRTTVSPRDLDNGTLHPLADELRAAAEQALRAHGDERSTFSHWIDGYTMYFKTVDSRRCLCSGERHFSNNFRITVDEDGELIYWCYDEPCSRRPFSLGHRARRARIIVL